MRRVRSSHTAPEVALRKALWSKGLRYTLENSHLPGKPDLILPRHKLAVFVDGDFWHGGQWQKRKLRSIEDQFADSNGKEYWPEKLRKNMARDLRVTSELVASGWKVIRLWESDIDHHLDDCVEKVLAAVRGSRRATHSKNRILDKRFAEFFAGIGLMRMGLEEAGWNIAYANDIDPQKLEMYQAQFEDCHDHFALADINELEPSDIPTLALATASFPCTDLSLAGARRGLRGSQSSTFWSFVRLMEGLGTRKPPMVLIENVAAFLTSRKGNDLREALLALNKLGYSVDAISIDAAKFVPQSRQRLFIVGIQKTLRYLDGPRESVHFYQCSVRPQALADFIFRNPDIDWKLRELPDLPFCTSALSDVLEDLSDDSPEWWSRERAQYLLSQMSDRHRDVARSMISKEEWSYGTVFRRVRQGRSMAELRTDGIAGCLRTPKGGSARQILFKAGFGGYRVRLLTARECANLMGADSYNINVPLNQALFGFGDAVCVPVVSWIAKHYLNPVLNELIRNQLFVPVGHGA